jgi:hypothetical protein
MKILIVGLARSGTTALYFKIKAALPEKTWCLYEPPRFDPSDPGGAPDVLAKILIAPPNTYDYASFRDFDKKIMIVRDPRDSTVSRILYRPCGSRVFRQDEAKVAAVIDALRRKEVDPRSISLLALLDLYRRLTGEVWLPRSPELIAQALDFHRNNGDFIVYKYEDFIARNYVAIEDYLGVALPDGEADVTTQYEHVARTKAAHDWKNWFTAEDVAFFRPQLAPYMRAYGYPDDWTLAAEPCIRPEHGSDYVRRSVAFRSRQDRDLTKTSTP